MRLILCLILWSFPMLAAEGPFQGKCSSERNEVAGEIRILLEGNGELSFTLQGEEVKAKVSEWNLSADEPRKLRIVYRFMLGDMSLVSQATGVLKAGKIDGKYETKAEGDGSVVDTGTFNASVEKK